MIQYGTSYLNTVTPEAAAWVKANVNPNDVYYYTYPRFPWSHTLVDLGVLQWPQGAQRWATYHGLVTEDVLRVIRTEAYGNPAGGDYRDLDFIIKDESGTDEVKTKLFMLPPRPLAQCPPHIRGTDREMWMLTLVDVRYFWWYESKEIIVDHGVTTWDGLIDDIENALNITIGGDAVDSVYLTPPGWLTSRYRDLPLLLDGVANMIGRRLVRYLDGTVELQTPQDAKTDHDAQLTKWKRYAGGLYAFVAGEENDLEGNAPRSVDVIFPRANDDTMVEEVHRVNTTLASLDLDEYRGIVGFDVNDSDADEAETLFSWPVAHFVNGTLDNQSDIDNLAERMSEDYYRWRLGRQHQLYAGIVPYKPEGLSAIIEWCHRKDASYTRVLRVPWHSFFKADSAGICCDWRLPRVIPSGSPTPVQSGEWVIKSGFPTPIQSGEWIVRSGFPTPVISGDWIVVSGSPLPIPRTDPLPRLTSGFTFPVPGIDPLPRMTSGFPLPVPDFDPLIMLSGYPLPLRSGPYRLVPRYNSPVTDDGQDYTLYSGASTPLRSGVYQLLAHASIPITSGGWPSGTLGVAAVTSDVIASGQIGSGHLHADILTNLGGITTVALSGTPSLAFAPRYFRVVADHADFSGGATQVARTLLNLPAAGVVHEVVVGVVETADLANYKFSVTGNSGTLVGGGTYINEFDPGTGGTAGSGDVRSWLAQGGTTHKTDMSQNWDDVSPITGDVNTNGVDNVGDATTGQLEVYFLLSKYR